MSYYEQPDKFQPSAVTIQKWLATKKKTTAKSKKDQRAGQGSMA